jgi:hypothetical protein
MKSSPRSDGSREHSCKNKDIANEEIQVFIKQKSDDYKSFLGCYPKSTKCSSPGRCSPSSAWRERRMDFVPEKPEMLAFLGMARAPHGLHLGAARA